MCTARLVVHMRITAQVRGVLKAQLKPLPVMDVGPSMSMGEVLHDHGVEAVP